MKTILLVIISALLVSVAYADFNAGPFGKGFFASGASGSGPPPGCTNKLDFSVACNSQYIGVI